MAEFSENEVKSQEVPLTGTVPEPGQMFYEAAVGLYSGRWAELRDIFKPRWAKAEAHFLQALEQMELPEEVSRVGRETLLTHGRTLDDAFRAICAALRSPKTGGESHE